MYRYNTRWNIEKTISSGFTENSDSLKTWHIFHGNLIASCFLFQLQRTVKLIDLDDK
jgi:hypothetical protein